MIKGEAFTWRFGKGGIKAAVVNQRIGHQEEVGDERSDAVQVTCEIGCNVLRCNEQTDRGWEAHQRQ